MVKKALNPLKIDFKKRVVEDCLLQILDEKNLDEPELINVWTIEIDAKSSKLLIDFIRRKVQQEDTVTFNHVKRIRKLEKAENILEVIICSAKYVKDESAFVSLLKDCRFSYQNSSCQNVIPKQGAPTKELSMKWSQLYWPLNWCGNPNDQILNSYTFDMDYIRKILAKITLIAKEEAKKGNPYPIVTAFVDPVDSDHPVISIDQRTSENGYILDHSVMMGIKKVAETSIAKNSQLNSGIDAASTYLCLNFDVYTTHEPCSMCSMALIHSRIKRCIFILPAVQTGSLKADSGDGYCMHCNKSLNSKYEVFQWIGTDFPSVDIAPDVCC